MRLNQLFEGISEILFHSTSIHNLEKILKTNQFRLTPDYGTQSELSYRWRDKPYYLSTSRSTIGKYGYIESYQKMSAKIVLNGRKLQNDGYSGRPLDYYGHRDEHEDRIYSSEPFIENATNYIKEIHVYIKTDVDKYDIKHLDIYKKIARTVIILAKKYNLPVYLYNDPQSFNLMVKNKSINPAELLKQENKQKLPLPDIENFQPARGYANKTTEFDRWIELLLKPKYVKLSKKAASMIYYILNDYYQREQLTSLKNSIHNSRTHNREELEKLLNIMRKLGLKSADDVIAFIREKYNDYYEDERYRDN